MQAVTSILKYIIIAIILVFTKSFISFLDISNCAIAEALLPEDWGN
jgi:hypothetical protein